MAYRFLLMGLVALTSLLIAAPAAAYDEETSNTGGIRYKTYIEMEWSASGPYIISCIASSGQGQQCRKCHSNYAYDGQTVTETVCLYVRSSERCKCTFKSNGTSVQTCTTEGSCIYQ